MSNIHEINVADENLFLELWQYDAGQKLKFVTTTIADGSHVLFANSETRKAIRKEVASNQVGIPNKFLRATGKMHITIETFNENEETTLYEINGYIKRRQDGEPGTSPEDEPTFIQKIIQTLNELKDKVENWFYTKSEVDNKDDFVLGEAKSYADGKDQDILGEAKGYTNTIALGLGNDLVVDLNTSTYILTLTLKHGEEILATRSVDLPLESTVVSGRYDKTSKKLILTLVSGEVIEIPLGDLIDGLVSTDDLASALANYQPKITPQNKISADNVDDSESENQFTNATEKTYWNNKPNVFRGNDKPTNVITDYPNVKGGDLYINQQADYVNRIWYCESVFGETVNWQISVRNIFYGTTPFTSWQDMNTQTNMSSMQKGTLYEKTNGDVYILIDNTSATWVWSKIATQSDLASKQDTLIPSTNITIGADGKTISATDTTYSAGNGLSLSGGAFSVDRPLPSSAQADSGKFLVVGNSGSPEWQLVSNAEDNSY